MKYKKILFFAFSIFFLPAGLLWALDLKEPLSPNIAVPVTQDSAMTAKEDSQSDLISIDYRDVDIKEVARAFSEISGRNIIVSDEAKASVTLKMSDVAWRTALSVILDTYNLASVEKDDFIIITTLDRRRQQEESGALETKIIRLNFVNVDDVQTVLQSVLSTRGKINTDKRTNSLVIMDIKDRLGKVEEVARQLDTRTPQVLIETLVVDVKLTDDFKWGVIENISNHIRSEYTDATEDETRWDKSAKWTGASSILDVSSGSTFEWSKTVFNNMDLDLTLKSMLKNSHTRVLANPRVVTLDNLAATINVVTQYPYATSTATTGVTTTTYEYKDVGITLDVTPHITADNFISMVISTEYSVRAEGSGDVPTVDTRNAATNVLVKDGETIVMGGLRRQDFGNNEFKIPLLGDIPLLGNLFRSKNKSTTETELVIFITPHVIGDGVLTDAEKLQLEQKKDLRDLTAATISFKDKKLLPLRPPLTAK